MLRYFFTGINSRERTFSEINAFAPVGSAAAEDGPLLAVLGAYIDAVNAFFLAGCALACLHLVHYSGERNRKSQKRDLGFRCVYINFNIIISVERPPNLLQGSQNYPLLKCLAVA